MSVCFRLLHVYIASIYMTKKFNPYIWPKNSHLPLPHHHPHYPIHYHFDPSHHYLHLSIPYQYIENTITNQGFFGFWFLNSLSKKKKHTHTHTQRVLGQIWYSLELTEPQFIDQSTCPRHSSTWCSLCYQSLEAVDYSLFDLSF